jgi:hypothetical protein
VNDPKTHAELKARYEKVLGRKPTEAEADRLMADLDELGVSYDDPVLLQVMLFQRERLALEEIFRQNVGEIDRHLTEARDQVLKETDKVLLRRMGEIVIAGSQALESKMTELKEKLEAEHRTALVAAVKSSTAEAVKGKFDETWTKEWAALMKRFSDDWNGKVNPAIKQLEETIHHERRIGLMWFGIAMVLAVGLGFAFGTRLFPVCPPVEVQQVEPAGKSAPKPVPGAQRK